MNKVEALKIVIFLIKNKYEKYNNFLINFNKIKN